MLIRLLSRTAINLCVSMWKKKIYFLNEKNKFKFNNYPKGIYNLIILSLAVCRHADDQIWLPKHVGGISQYSMEKCGRLIYVNANELRHRMTRSPTGGEAPYQHISLEQYCFPKLKMSDYIQLYLTYCPNFILLKYQLNILFMHNGGQF